MKFLLTAGQVNDITQAEPLIEGLAAEQVVADKGDDGDKVIEAIKKSGAEAVIPPKKNRKVQREYDPHLYKQRHQIERLIGKLKQCRRIATHYEKTSRNDMAFRHLAATMILLA